MREHLRKLITNRQGSTIVIVAFAMAALLTMVAVVIDGGSLYATKRHLQKTANAAVLSGAQELTNTETDVDEVARAIITKHGEENSETMIEIEMGNKVSVFLDKQVSLGFSKLIGMDSVQVKAKATAEILSMGAAYGAAPIGIDESIQLEFNTPYTLKVDQTEVSAGNFGILALGGQGSRTYLENLIKGYQSELSVGQIVPTESGNNVGATRTGIADRLNKCPYEAGETHHRDCPRVILIPVYKPHNVGPNKVHDVQITGFAYFYILEPVDNNDKTIRGMFIEKAGNGIYKPGAVDRGAYAIRLTE